MTKQIPLTRGKFALVDDIDFEYLNQFFWGLANGYVKRGSKNNGCVYMHREIMNPPVGMHIDHINGNKLDNRRENLRTCTRAENNRNARKIKKTSSRYKGVTPHGQCAKWKAQIQYNHKHINLGLFEEEVDAAHAYDAAAKRLHGPFANLNFPEKG